MKKIMSNILSGVVTALFSIPEGMAYAKLAGVNPVYGLYTGMLPTITASLTTGTVLMLSTLTSAIAISTRSVLEVSGVGHSALFTLTFLIGTFMLILGLLRLGKIVNFVSNSVLTGFVVGASFLIMVGELGELVGLEIKAANKFQLLVKWFLAFPKWNPIVSAVGFGSIALMVILQFVPKVKEAAAMVVLVVGTLVVHFFQLDDVMVVRDISTIPSSFPKFVLPDPAVMPRLTLGAISVALVALVQGAGVSSAVSRETNYSRDFFGQGLGNLVGSFFQSMGSGGSLSRTAVSVGAGSTSRLGGVFAGCWLILIVLLAGHLIEYVPLPVMSGILCVIAIKLIMSRLSDIKLILISSLESTAVMSLTFISALFIPLQWTIFLGAGLSLLFYLYTSITEVRLYQLIKNEEGYYEEHPLPGVIPSHQETILDFEGNLFFAEVPVIKRLMPSIKETTGAVLIWRVRGMEDVHSTFLKWLEYFVHEFRAKGNRFVLVSVEPHVMKILEKTKLVDLIGKENIYPAEAGIGEALDKAIRDNKPISH